MELIQPGDKKIALNDLPHRNGKNIPKGTEVEIYMLTGHGSAYVRDAEGNKTVAYFDELEDVPAQGA